jgi:dephospho-CoA kinase
MISLIKPYKELNKKPKAIFMAGPPGSGKSFILNKFSIPSKFQVINVDDIYEELLKTQIGKMDLKKMNLDELSKTGELMNQARKQTKEKEEDLLIQKQNVVIDGVGASSKNLLEKKKYIESLGYETFMILVYVSPIVSLERNLKRDRQLPTRAVLDSWVKVINNIDTYKNEFKNNIIIINNNPSEITPLDIDTIFNQYPDPEGKEKTPEEIEKRNKLKQSIIDNIKVLIKKEQSFTPDSQIQPKINEFISQ